jgi:hypothetical protein
MPGGKSVIVAYYNPAHVADGIAQEIRSPMEKCSRSLSSPGRLVLPVRNLELDGATCVFFTTAIEGMPEETRAIAPEAGTIFVAGLGTSGGQS